jgi:hypothetical protein
MRTSQPQLLVWLVTVFSAVPLYGKDFSIRIVDGLGRAIPGVVVDLHWLKKDKGGDVQKAELAKVKTDERGVARGAFNEKAVPSDESTFVELTKAGYSRYTSSRLQSELVLKRQFTPENLRLIANLPENARSFELQELLAGDFEGEDLEQAIFLKEDSFRPALRRIIDDPRIARQAFSILALIGVPEDLRLILKHAPIQKRSYLRTDGPTLWQQLSLSRQLKRNGLSFESALCTSTMIYGSMPLLFKRSN